MKILTVLLAISTILLGGLYFKEKWAEPSAIKPSANDLTAHEKIKGLQIKDNRDLSKIVSEEKADLEKVYSFSAENWSEERQQLINQLASLSATNALLLREVTGYRENQAIKEEIKELSKEEVEEKNLARAERILNAADSVAVQFVSLDQIDRSRFSEEQLQNHDKLLEMLAEVEIFLEDVSMSDDIRSELRGQFYKKIPELKKLYANEREMLMRDMLSRDLGYKSNEANVIINEYKFIETLTSIDGMMRRLHSPPKKSVQ